jgi:DNA-binding NtrC family response regulator
MNNKKIHILLIDDDKYFRLAIKHLLESEAIFTEADNEVQAIDLINNNYFDIALIDMEIDGPKSGLTILKRTKAKQIHSIIISSQTDEAIIEAAYQNHCDHFLTKLHYKKHLAPYIHKYKIQLFGKGSKDFFKSSYITQDEKLIKDIDDICQMSLKDKSLLMTGETGVGKTLIAKLFHEQTYDESKPFIHINCSEITESLMESELFGHTKGAFTGALSAKTGKLELANGGTLFLDEVGTMPLNMQQKLLNAIDLKTFYPVGSERSVSSEFTLITATCDDLFEKIHREEFRKDFFFRISGINLHIHPLRKRKDDIPLLIKYFQRKLPRKIIIKDDALSLLVDYNWPGNIRELLKYMEKLSSKNQGIIEPQDIVFLKENQPTLTDYLTNQQKDFISENGLRAFIKKIEEETLLETLKRHKGKITHAIRELRISSSAFYRIFENVKIKP